jgi:hypothetical protein
MTRRFLDILFAGRWDYYGHWSMTVIIGLVLLPWCGLFAGLIAWTLMFMKEVYDGVKAQFHWPDVLYNTYGMFTVWIIAII